MTRHFGLPPNKDVAAQLKRDAALREAAAISFLIIFGVAVFGLVLVICWSAGAMLGSS